MTKPLFAPMAFAALLMGSKTGRKIGGEALKLGGMAAVGKHVHLMLGLGLVMMLLALHVYFAPLKRLKLAVTAGDVAEAGRRVGQIRLFVGINLVLGLIVIAVASGGRYFLSGAAGV